MQNEKRAIVRADETKEECENRKKTLALYKRKWYAQLTLEQRKKIVKRNKLNYDKMIAIMSDDERNVYNTKRNDGDRERKRMRKEKFELIIAKGEDKWSIEEQIFFWKYVFDTTNKRRKNRRSLAIRNQEYSSSRYNSTLYMTGFTNVKDFVGYLGSLPFS